MPHHDPNIQIDFECTKCGEEFSKNKGFRKFTKNGQFVCYRTRCPECGGLAETLEGQEEVSLEPGAHKTRSPMMKERDFKVRGFCPNDVITDLSKDDMKSDKHPFKGESDEYSTESEKTMDSMKEVSDG